MSVPDVPVQGVIDRGWVLARGARAIGLQAREPLAKVGELAADRVAIRRVGLDAPCDVGLHAPCRCCVQVVGNCLRVVGGKRLTADLICRGRHDRRGVGSAEQQARSCLVHVRRFGGVALQHPDDVCVERADRVGERCAHGDAAS